MGGFHSLDHVVYGYQLGAEFDWAWHVTVKHHRGWIERLFGAKPFYFDYVIPVPGQPYEANSGLPVTRREARDLGMMLAEWLCAGTPCHIITNARTVANLSEGRIATRIKPPSVKHDDT